MIWALIALTWCPQPVYTGYNRLLMQMLSHLIDTEFHPFNRLISVKRGDKESLDFRLKAQKYGATFLGNPFP